MYSSKEEKIIQMNMQMTNEKAITAVSLVDRYQYVILICHKSEVLLKAFGTNYLCDY